MASGFRARHEISPNRVFSMVVTVANGHQLKKGFDLVFDLLGARYLAFRKEAHHLSQRLWNDVGDHRYHAIRLDLGIGHHVED